jgi:two-component system, chemotaxis family, chemotaxis protein CheY
VSFTRHLKATPHLSGIPIIMMTGDASRERLASSIEAGAADFIVKPFRRESLKAKLEKLLSL